MKQAAVASSHPCPEAGACLPASGGGGGGTLSHADLGNSKAPYFSPATLAGAA